jgi:hypothetical protein
MNEKTVTSTSFWQLLKKKKIEIPIIQRDYAQGRKESPEDEKYDIEEIRENFLDYLFSCLTDENADGIELDFIYGNEKDENENEYSVYQLLDGQQRLTTLFLLHWYAASKEGFIKDNTETLKKFTYETRTSSREFCEKLVIHGIDFKNLNEADKSQNNQISKTIKDSFWFFKVWEKDPTIVAMLNMLDAIHVKAKAAKDPVIWKKLTCDNKITFLNFPLKDFGLSDDLYIKMNARGKLLTGFENLKAELQKKIKEGHWEDDLDPRETFLLKSDTTWTDLFWSYRDEDNKIDSAFLQVIVFSMLGNIALRLGTKDEKTIQKIYNKPEDVVKYVIKEDVDYLKKVMDIYYKDDTHKVRIDTTFWGDLDDDDKPLPNFFDVLVQAPDLAYWQLVLYYAQTEYLLKNGTANKDMFNDWIRAVRNIVYNQDVNDAASYISALQLIRELLNGADNIYSYLAGLLKPESGFAAKQMKEELFKAKIIIKSEQNKKIIFRTEDTNFCKGRIGFALYCIGCENNIEAFKAVKLSEIQKVIKDNLEEEDISNDFRRALLTIGDNNFYEYWGSWLYAADAPKRCLIADIGDLQNSFAYNRDDRFRNYLKDLLNELTNSSLIKIIEDYHIPRNMPKWKKRLIKEDDLLDYSEKHYIAIADDDTCCWLIPGSKVANTDEGFDRLMEIG